MRLTVADFWHTAGRGVGSNPQQGWYPGPTVGEGNNTANVGGNVLRAEVPLFTSAHSMHVVTLLGVSFGGATSCFAHIGIYEADANCFPSARVYDSGQVTLPDGGGPWTVAPSYTLKPRQLYWLVTLTNSSWNRQERGASIDVGFLGQGSLSSALGARYSVVVSYGYGALPDNFPTSAVSLAGDGGRLMVIFA